MADETETGTGTFSDLSIGIRELFRIVVPGTYAVLLFEWLTAGKFEISGEGRTLTRIAVTVLVGLIAYGLQVHEKWFPYNVVFERGKTDLNRRIIEIGSASGDSKDYVGEYKYFLETRAPEIKERIHYFTSFYYMLDEMSLISAIAAIALVFMFFRELNPDWPMSVNFVLVGIVLQLITLHRDSYSKAVESYRLLEKIPRWMLKYAASWLGIVTIWLLWNWTLAFHYHRTWPFGPLFRIDWRFWALICVSMVFERLGAKQWNSIMKEQLVLVNNKRTALREVISGSSGT
jgi:hypothetical protein